MDYQLVDDGTLDTVFNVYDGDGEYLTSVRFGQEYACDFRDEGGLTDEGLEELGKEAIESAFDWMLDLED